MSAYIVIFPLLCFQCISTQCIGSRMDELISIPNVPVEYLAIGNYGAMDFLPTSDYLPNMLPMVPIPSVQEGIYGDRFNPYTIDPIIFEFPSSFEPYVGNQIASPSLLKPTGFSLPLEVSLSSTYPYSEQYSFNPFAYPAAATSASVGEVLNPFGYSALPAAVISSSIADTLSPFGGPALPMATISSPISEVFNPFAYATPSLSISPPGFEVPLPFETPALINPYTTPLFANEAPCVTNLPNNIAPLSTFAESAATGVPNILPSSQGFSPRISELLRSFTPSMNIKCLGGSGPSTLAASKGRGFLVTSSSPIRPTGISIVSENVYQGSLSVSGKLPFLGTVGFGGTLPSYGSGSVNYRCANGNVAILSEENNIF